jgi:hypothetical protein
VGEQLVYVNDVVSAATVAGLSGRHLYTVLYGGNKIGEDRMGIVFIVETIEEQTTFLYRGEE